MQENSSARGNYAAIRPPRILSGSFTRDGPDSGSPRKSSQQRRGSKSFMGHTVSSTIRAKKTLNLREKIFELHDAVKELQSKPSTQTNSDQEPVQK